MDINAVVGIIAGLLSVGALFLGSIARRLEKNEADRLQAERLQELMQRQSKGGIYSIIQSGKPPPPPKPKGFVVLAVFAVIVVLFGVCTAVYFWDYIRNNVDKAFFVAWLFLAMVFGMFVQVLNELRRAKQPLSAVKASDLLFPLLFSIVIFYAVWGTVGSASHNFFAFYAAFLNGFFWQTTVAQTKPLRSRSSSTATAKADSQ